MEGESMENIKGTDSTIEVYDGNHVQAWKDDVFMYLSIHPSGITIAIPLSHLSEVTTELVQFAFSCNKN